jgi:hypothetical protein
MTWFQQLFGFVEKDYASTQQRFDVRGEQLCSRVNGRCFQVGRWNTLNVTQLKHRAMLLGRRGRARLSHTAANDVLALHALPENAGALFQAASQFNCLEFATPSMHPELGVTGYADDHTQGPACSLAAAAATVYRNYFAPVPCGGGPGSDTVPRSGDVQRSERIQRGQTAECQLNMLDDLERLLDNATHRFFTVRNGYTDSTDARLAVLNRGLREARWNAGLLTNSVKVGFQERVGVTFAKRSGGRFVELTRTAGSTVPTVPLVPAVSTVPAVPAVQLVSQQPPQQLVSQQPPQQLVSQQPPQQLVSQVFVSALSCNYSKASLDAWEPLARIVLNAVYEATLWAGVVNAAQGGSNIVYLTLVGGGVYRNRIEWIAAAIGRAMGRVAGFDLDVRLVHYREIAGDVAQLIDGEVRRYAL